MEVIISVYDINGKLVNKLHEGNINPGHHRIIWNSLNSNGVSMPSGVYIYEIIGDGVALRNKMMLLK